MSSKLEVQVTFKDVDGCSTLALNTMVISLFNGGAYGPALAAAKITTPLHAFAVFLSVFAHFDWSRHAATTSAQCGLGV